MPIDKQLMKGSMRTVVLQILSKRPMHGYQISQEIKSISDSRFSVTEGTLYPMLHALEADGILTAELSVTSGNRKRKTYRLTDKGKEVLAKKKKEWVDFNNVMEGLIASYEALGVS